MGINLSSVSSFKIPLIILISIMMGPINGYTTPLTDQEKLEFIRSSSTACIAKNNAGRVLNQSEKSGVENYCICHATVMASLATREEMKEVKMGGIPKSFQSKVIEARTKCIDAMSR